MIKTLNVTMFSDTICVLSYLASVEKYAKNTQKTYMRSLDTLDKSV